MNLRLVLGTCCVLVVQFGSITMESFTCSENGRFPNPESVDCKTYYMCSTTSDGNITASLQKCPGANIFDGSQGRCVGASLYTCPDPVTTTTEASTTAITSTESPTGFVCPSGGRYPNPESVDCKTYYLCALTSDGNIVASLGKCPGSNIFDGSQGRCVGASLYKCPDPVTTTTEASTTAITSTESPTRFVCPSEGRYPNPESVDCKMYYICARTSDGNIVASLGKCPGNNIFDGSLLRCVGSSAYTCPNEVTSSTVEPSTEPITTTVPFTPEPTTTTNQPSTIQPTTSEPTTTAVTPNIFTCVSSGRFPNPEQPDCQTYKYCLQTTASTFQEYTFRCPAGSNFNPAEARCTVGYSCPKTLTTTTTEAPSTTVAAAFRCETEGRFADPVSCNQYIFCTRTADGNLVQHAFRCPPNSWFKPNESRCSASYVCN